MKNSKGFSILEIILVIGIMAVIGLISSSLLTRTYRTNNESDTLSKLKQNGQVAVSAISDTIRMADAVVCYGVNGSRKDRIVIQDLAGEYIMFRFVDQIPATGKITSNGYIAKYENITGELKDFCTQTPTGPESDLTDRNIDTGVSISNGDFKKLSGEVSKDAVTIIFNVNPAGNQSGSTAIVNIQSTVQIR